MTQEPRHVTPFVRSVWVGWLVGWLQLADQPSRRVGWWVLFLLLVVARFGSSLQHLARCAVSCVAESSLNGVNVLVVSQLAASVLASFFSLAQLLQFAIL